MALNYVIKCRKLLKPQHKNSFSLCCGMTIRWCKDRKIARSTERDREKEREIERKGRVEQWMNYYNRVSHWVIIANHTSYMQWRIMPLNVNDVFKFFSVSQLVRMWYSMHRIHISHNSQTQVENEFHNTFSYFLYRE